MIDVLPKVLRRVLVNLLFRIWKYIHYTLHFPDFRQKKVSACFEQNTQREKKELKK